MIPFIALFIYHILCDRKIKKWCLIVLIFVPINLIYNNTVIAKIKNSSEIEPIPYTHWVMTGMNKETMGGYNDNDYNVITHPIRTKKERKEINIIEIKKRLSDFGPIGYIDFLVKKAIITWGDGTFFVPEKLRRQVTNYSLMHEFVLVDGQYFSIYFTFSQIVYFTIMIFVTISSFILLNRKDYHFVFSPLLALLGIFLFLLIWETRSRYLVNFIPILILSSLVGFEFVFEKLIKIKNHKH
jgi:hypothetical protein